jgi:hypothetical protein
MSKNNYQITLKQAVGTDWLNGSFISVDKRGKISSNIQDCKEAHHHCALGCIIYIRKMLLTGVLFFNIYMMYAYMDINIQNKPKYKEVSNSDFKKLQIRPQASNKYQATRAKCGRDTPSTHNMWGNGKTRQNSNFEFTTIRSCSTPIKLELFNSRWQRNPRFWIYRVNQNKWEFVHAYY